jgi:gliding motility-associated lipoprotein GldH
MRRKLFLLAITLVILAGCGREEDYQVYHRFADKTWFRFNILQFEIPVKKSDQPVNVVFFARHDREYPYDSLAFNMVLRTPSGEERIRECRLKIRDKSGNFLGTFKGDSCEMTFLLRKEMVVDRDGILVVELENLLPRMRTTGLYGAGIRLEKP